MRIATFVHNGKRQVGQVSANGLQVTPFALSESQAQRGAQPIIEALVAGQPLPALAGAALAVSSAKLAFGGQAIASLPLAAVQLV